MGGWWDKENIKGDVIDQEERKKKRSTRVEISTNPSCVYHLELLKCVEMNDARQIRANI